jgi:hypothetical protein
MKSVLTSTIVALAEAAPKAAGFSGKWAFVAVLALLLVWLVLMPRRFIGQAQGVPPWWRNVRVWAIVVALLQLGIYLYWG